MTTLTTAWKSIDQQIDSLFALNKDTILANAKAGNLTNFKDVVFYALPTGRVVGDYRSTITRTVHQLEQGLVQR